MSSIIEPYHPLNVLKPVAPDVWIVDGPLMRTGPGGIIAIPIRMTIARLPDGKLWLHSPVQFDPALASAVQALGDIGHLVAPNLAHNSFIGDWQRAFPDAVLYAVEGVAKHAAKQKRPLRVDAAISADPDPRWGSAFAVVLTRSSYMTEAAFFHNASRTLILTDLIENFEPEKVHSAIMRLGLRAASTLAPHGSTPRYLRLTFLGKRRRQLRAAARLMLSCDPARVIFAHGRWFESDGTGKLRAALQWLKP
jgi:hypothetical protein